MIRAALLAMCIAAPAAAQQQAPCQPIESAIAMLEEAGFAPAGVGNAHTGQGVTLWVHPGGGWVLVVTTPRLACAPIYGANWHDYAGDA